MKVNIKLYKSVDDFNKKRIIKQLRLFFLFFNRVEDNKKAPGMGLLNLYLVVYLLE